MLLLTRVCGALSVGLGAVVLVGWYGHVDALIQVLPIFALMQYNTALGFVLCGTGLVAITFGQLRLGSVCGSIAGAMGLLTLAEYTFGFDLGIDQLLMEHYITVQTSHPGRMAPNTALCFSLAGTALLISGRSELSSRRPYFIGALATVTLLLGSVELVGYLGGLSSSYSWGQLTRMAVHTSVGFIVLGVGVFAKIRRDMKAQPISDPAAQRRWVFVLSVFIMSTVTFAVTLDVIRQLRDVAFEQKKEDLSTIATSLAGTINAVARFDAEHDEHDEHDHLPDDVGITLNRLAEANEAFFAIGETGEIVLGRFQGDEIVLLFKSRHDGRGERTVPDPRLAEPMRRALSGESGTVIGLDYRDEMVLAAHVPMENIGWGIVAKIDLAEIWRPFERVTFLAVGTALVVIVLGAFAFLMTVDPVFRGLVLYGEERTRDLRAVQGDLVRKERLAILGTLAGGVGHELRNPLGVISNAIYYLRMTHSDADEKTREYLGIISSEVGNAEKIVSDLLDFTRAKTAVREEADVSDLVAQVLEKRDLPEEIKVTTEFPADLPAVFVDPRQIEQVLTNLITNACQAMPEGGALTIRAEGAPSREGGPADRIRLTVADTGCGISAATLEKIFDPLYTTRARGIGLGLSVTRNLVEANGGSITVESHEGEGSTFDVLLPTKEVAS